MVVLRPFMAEFGAKMVLWRATRWWQRVEWSDGVMRFVLMS